MRSPGACPPPLLAATAAPSSEAGGGLALPVTILGLVQSRGEQLLPRSPFLTHPAPPFSVSICFQKFPSSQERTDDTHGVYPHTSEDTQGRGGGQLEGTDQGTRQDDEEVSSFSMGSLHGQGWGSPVQRAALPGTEELPAELDEVEGASSSLRLDPCGLCCAPALFLLTHSQGNFCQGPESQSFFASGSCSSIAFTPEPLTLDYLGSTDPSFPW